MSNTTYTASKRQGGRTSCASGMRRISVTLTENAFLRLRELADRAHRGLSGEAAAAIEQYVSAAGQRGPQRGDTSQHSGDAQ